MNEAIAIRNKKMNEALECIASRARSRPEVGIVLGSGLGDAARAIEVRASIPYAEIPHFPSTTVSGHPGNLLVGRLAGVDVVVLQGRLHYYEGYAMSEVVFPIDLLGLLGAKVVVETCAVGALRRGFDPGDLVSVSDHVNLMGDNPLLGVSDDLGRFVDMTDAYAPDLRRLMKEAAREAGLDLKEGVYAAVQGPSYEKPAEERLLSGNADHVRMSLVPELKEARSLGLEVAAVAVVSNAHGRGEGVSHAEVLEVAKRAVPKLEKLLIGFTGKVSGYLIDRKGDA